MYIFMDLETYSECDIKRGAYAYAEHPTTEVLLWGYAIGDAPAKVWDVTRGEAMPHDLHEALGEVMAGEAKTVWHNGFNFDTNVLAQSRDRRTRIRIPRSAIIDTMHIAYQHGLPGALGDLCTIYGLGEDKAKDRDGKRLVQLFCKPHRYGKNDPTKVRYNRVSRPEDWERFVNYCRLDVEAERELFKRLPRINLTRQERALELLDDRINQRGMLMDTDLARAAIKALEDEAKANRSRTAELTGGALDSTTRTAALIAYLKDRFGIELKNLQKNEVARLIEDDTIPEPMRDLLRIRLTSAKASVKKYQAILDCVNSDGRLRGCLQFRGASRTGRWSGRLFQPQNLPRQTKDPDDVNKDIDDLKAGELWMWARDLAGDLAQALRGAIIVPPGKKMVVADYSNIEGRVLAWVAGEKWKLQAFRDYDAGTGPDLYKLTYARAFNIDVAKVTKPQRQMGKVLELAMGYGGGVGAFVAFATGYSVHLETMADSLDGVIPSDVYEESCDLYEWAAGQNRLGGLSRKVWIACDSVKRLWRRSNPHIVALWDSAAAACVTAIREPGVKVGIALDGAVHAVRKGSWLYIRLPSGRFLCYPSARLGSKEEGCDLTYMGVNQYTRKWERIKTFAGKLVENTIQAIACDVLAAALPRLDANGYEPILTVHDEVLAEALDTDEFTHERMEKLMATNPKWAEGLPLAAAGFESKRYHK